MNSINVCVNCNCKIEDNSFKTHEEKIYCNECFNKLFFICHSCHDTVELGNHTLDYRGNKICNDCIDRYYFYCDSCNQYFNLNYTGRHEVDEEYLCDNCFYDNYSYCNRCGEVICNESIYYDENDVPFCESCFEEQSIYKNSCKNLLPSEYFVKENSFKVFGVEIEAITEGKVDKSKLEYFKVVSDCSLNSGGKEYVTCPLPLNKEGYTILKEFNENIGKRNLTIDSSCGLHIHIYVDKTLVTLSNLKKIIQAYTNLEELFFKMNPISRQDNHMCKSIKNSSLYGKLIEKSIQEYDLSPSGNVVKLKKPISYSRVNTIKEFLEEFYNMDIRMKNSFDFTCIPRDKYHPNRYFYVNLHSIFFRNTIEIRLHSGTYNHDKIFNWVKIHSKLLEYVVSHTSKTIEKLTPSYFINHVLNNELRKYVIDRLKLHGGRNNEYLYEQKQKIIV